MASRTSTTSVATFLAIALAAATAARAQPGTGGTITSNDAVFHQGDAPTSSIGTGVTPTDFFVNGPGGTEQCFEHWWWVRVVGVDTREFCLANATSPVWSGDTGSMTFVGATYTAVATWKVAGGPTGSNKGQVTAKLRLTNNTGAPVTLAVYSYLDYDMNGTAGLDSATLVSPERMQISDGASTTTGEFFAPGAAAYRVTQWAALQGTLVDALVTPLDNTGLPFASSDWTGAFQFNVALAASGTSTVTSVFSVNQPATAGCPVDIDGNGQVQPADISLFVNTWFNDLVNGTHNADFDGNGQVQPADVSVFVASWFTAVSSGTC